MEYKGTIIKESLENEEVLQAVNIISTKVEEVTDRHKTPWIKQWTLHTVEIPEGQAEEVAEKISRSLDSQRVHSWYADYKNDKTHYIIFRHKVFKIDRTSIDQYQQARDYGISLGIPEYQVNFKPSLTK